ncbi:MAG TPA: DNA internalization-related competence protein ComEC/Rec2 [Verrucomicrobiae bacterium]|nr:DNA internalization-related competence protein ComEC/Rec2 [Verrucomicrobiae bacterium]
MKRPLTGLVLGYALGIGIGSLTDWPAATVFYWVAGLLVVFVFLNKTRFGISALLAAVCAAGIFADRQATTISSPIDITRLVEPRDQNISLRGTIVSDTGYRTKPASGGGRQQFELDLRALQHDGEWQPATGRILVFVSDARKPEAIRYGDLVAFTAILRVPQPLRNPGSFDWRAWLQRRGIRFTATIRKSDSIEVEAHHQANPIIRISLGLREQLERALQLGLEDEPKLGGVLAGMVLGERAEIPPDTYADFQHTGVFHVFAISGLHVGLVTGVVLIALHLLRVPRRWCGFVAIPLLVLYVFATGARPGAVRALVMACAWLIAWMLVRPADPLNTLAGAALVLLIWDPTQLFDGGFILSFMAVLALLMLSPRFEKTLRNLLAPDALLPRDFVPRWRLGIDPALIWFIRLVSASLAAWLGLLPLMAAYFHLFTPVSIGANLFVIPLLGVIIAIGITSLLAFFVWPWLTLTLNNANLFLIGTMLRGVQALGHWSFGHQFMQAPPWWWVLAYYACGALLLSSWFSPRRRRLAVSVAIPCIGVALVLNGGRARKVDLTVLALSDGMAVFVDSPGERGDILIDGGSDWSGAHVVVPFLRARGVDRLAATMLTRGDKAHAAGLCVVANEVPTREAIYSGIPSRSKYYSQWKEHMQALQAPLRVMKAGDDLNLAAGVRLRVLNPPPDAVFSRSEDNALVLAIEFGATRVLHMSDVGDTIEKRLLKEIRDLHAQVIVKGQHGHEMSCTPEFLDAVRPEVVIQSVATSPSNRYPEPGLRERLAERGIALYRTDETGAVTIRLTRSGYEIRPFLK